MSRPEAAVTLAEPAPVFAALADPTRLELISRLGRGRPHSISELATDLPLTRQAVTKHLRLLEQAGIVTSERVGRETRFDLTPAPLRAACSYLDRISEQWDGALSRLRALVEND